MFDRIVEALLQRAYADCAIVRAVNGRGGDGGTDFEVIDGTHRTVFLLKYYPDGFPKSTYKGRQASITASFHRAMQNPPDEWVLVVPCTLSDPEAGFVHGLAMGHAVRVRVMDRPQLDNGLADFPNLAAYFARNTHNDEVKTFIEREIVPQTSGAIADRIMALGRVIDSIDEHWAFDFEHRDGTVIRRLRAQHPRAHERSPIRINVAASWDLLDPGTTAAFQRAVGYGFPEQVTLHPDVVERIDINGPAWLSESSEHVQVTWVPDQPTAPTEITAELRFTRPDGARGTTFQGLVEHHGTGTIGRSLILRFFNTATLSLAIPYSHAPQTIRLRADLTGITPATALLILNLDHHLYSDTPFDIAISGTVVGTGTAEVHRDPEDIARIDQLRAFVDDLAAVQQHLGQHFPVPERTTSQERVDLRAARLLLDGHCVAMPAIQSLPATLTGLDDPVVRDLLSADPQGLQVEIDYVIEVAGHLLPIGRVRICHTQLTAFGRETALAALDRGEGGGAAIEFVPVNKDPFLAFMADRWTGSTVPVTSTPLGLPSIGAEPSPSPAPVPRPVRTTHTTTTDQEPSRPFPQSSTQSTRQS